MSPSTIVEDQILELTFDDVDVQPFKVDRSRRQLTGLILPWGQVGRNERGNWRFQRGSLKFGDVSRVKLLRDHNPYSPVGVALELVDRSDGLHGTFSVARGAAGDEVLSLAEDGVLDGFSAGPRIQADGWEFDSQDRDVRLVTDARLVETTVTAFPAFDDARVQSVKLMGVNMPDDNKPDTGTGGTGATVLDKPDAALEKFQTDLDARLKLMMDGQAKATKAQGEQIAGTIAAAFDSAFQRLEGPDAADVGAAAAARFKVIKEPPVYRFTGDHRQDSLVRDAWHWHIDRDYDSRDRLRKFQEQQADIVKFATVTTGTAADVIPPGYRPDLYVTELMQGRPIVANSSRGTISDATPFTVPRFGSATGATLDHVEGVNPADGTLAMQTVTVTPGAISGIFKLTREIIDSANPAIDAIAMQAMRESWNRQTEQKAYAELNGTATGTQVTSVSIAGLAVDPPAAGNIAGKLSRRLLAKYPFLRFAAPSGATISQTVTTNFASAEDSTGRPLFPSVGAQNTSGIGNAVQQGWFVDGLPHVPAWAMTEAVGDDILLIVNRSDWWTWESPLLTFRFEEKSGPALIELALFGYYATRVLRPTGIFALRALA